MISAILFINMKGETVIYRYYRDNVSRTSIDAFRTRVIAAKKTGVPVVNIDKTSFLYHRTGDMYVVAVTKQNANPALLFQFIYKLVDVFKAYFGGVFDEDAIKNNFVLIYELLDECMDHGYPQLTAVNLLREFIKHGTVKASAPSAGPDPETKDPSMMTGDITGSVDWRQGDGKIRHKKNEVFIDVLEAVNLLMSSSGATVLRADVSGKIVMKTFLSGMPECKFGMNDKLVMEKEAKSKSAGRAASGIAIDDVTFHRCVKLDKFDVDRTISFIPPDGEFELMKYRITQNVNLPFKVIPMVEEHGRSRVVYKINVTGNFSSKLFATNVILLIPCPPNVARANLSTVHGKAKYNSAKNCIVWKIKKFPGEQQSILTGEVGMVASTREKAWSRPPIVMEFQVPMFTSSGLHVRFMKVFERSNYETIKWVRYMTRAGSYQIRI